MSKTFKLSDYIIPSVISMVLVGTYTNIDGYFIGNTTGDDGLAAINLVWPIVALITSLGTGLGIGGCAIVNRLRGEGEVEKSRKMLNSTLLLLFVTGLFSSLVLTIIDKPILWLLGARGAVLEHALAYSAIICPGAVFQIVGAGLLAVLRNEGKAYSSMLYSVAGLLIHIALGAALAQKYLLFGVGIAVVLSQAVICVMGLLKLKKMPGFYGFKECLDILKASTAPLGLNFVPSVVLLLTNIFCLETGGTAAVSAYAVMSYAVYTYDYFFQGVCDGIQPIISYCNGAKDKKQEKKVILHAVGILSIFSVVFALLTPVMIKLLPSLFSASSEAAEMIASGMVIYAFSYPFKAAVKLVCAYFYSVEKTKIANFLIYIDPLLVTPVLLLILTRQFSTSGIWLSLTVAQIVIAAIGIAAIGIATIGIATTGADRTKTNRRL